MTQIVFYLSELICFYDSIDIFDATKVLKIEILSEMRNLEVRSYERREVEVEDQSPDLCWLHCNDTQNYYILSGCKLLKLTGDFEPELIAE